VLKITNSDTEDIALGLPNPTLEFTLLKRSIKEFLISASIVGEVIGASEIVEKIFFFLWN